ncbi:MAG TPA: arylamine N-acetyltransferase [Pilimelia sp.]|nr:arylamine N-acetyltransferase [Pilimelia sp.]
MSVNVSAYLRRLGVDDPGRPSVAALRRLHRAHVERVAYETLEIHLGRPTTVDPYESIDRIVHRGGGGYCFHLNGAFGTLLSAMGYEVTWHRGGVFGAGEDPPPGATGNHLALTVRGLPAPESPDGGWFVDVGLGDALHEPLPLRPGSYRQGPFRYELRTSPVEPAGWQFRHDPAGSFVGMDFAAGPAGPADFRARHIELSTSPESPFVRAVIVQRRHARGVDVLVGCRLKHLGAGEPVSREIATSREWYAVLAELFGLTLPDVSGAQRRELWSRVRAAHDAWAASREEEAA